MPRLTGHPPRLILVFAGRTSLVLSCTGGGMGLPHPLPLPICQQTRSVHDDYSWYSSRQASISIHPAFLRNKSIAYLENKYWTDHCHSVCKSELLFLPQSRKLRLQWLCIFKLDTILTKVMSQPYKMASAPAVWASSCVTGVQKHMEKTEVLETRYSYSYTRLDTYDHCQSINIQALTDWTDHFSSWTKSQTCSECEPIVVRPVLGRTYKHFQNLNLKLDWFL